jgi:hypothetical protein
MRSYLALLPLLTAGVSALPSVASWVVLGDAIEPPGTPPHLPASGSLSDTLGGTHRG